jgi:GT2 family glycosyltransferase
VSVLRPGSNLGFAGGCNLGARNASGDVLVFLNPDTVVARGAIRALADALEDRSVAIAMPRLRLLEEPDLLNSAGNVLHVSGLAWAGCFREPADSVGEVRDVAFASGAALAIRARLFWELGGFTDELFLYHEDLELSWRAHLRGLRVVVTPKADVLHDYVFERNPDKRYYLERNRLIFVLTSYSGRLLAVTAPLLITTEIAVGLLALREGWFRQKTAGWRWVLDQRDWLRRHRSETQSLRRRPDRELLPFFTVKVDPGAVSVPLPVRLLSPLLAGYWSLARRLL